MPPWLNVLDAALSVADVVTRRMSGRSSATRDRREDIAVAPAPPGGIEARLAGVVVAALKEAFDRDHSRLELEKEQLEAERRRAELALRLELIRQAAEREIGRLRLLAGVAVASWLGTLFFSTRLVSGPINTRVLLAVGWVLLLGALAAAFAGQSRLASMLPSFEDRIPTSPPSSGFAGVIAPWLIVTGLGVIGVAVLIT